MQGNKKLFLVFLFKSKKRSKNPIVAFYIYQCAYTYMEHGRMPNGMNFRKLYTYICSCIYLYARK